MLILKRLLQKYLKKKRKGLRGVFSSQRYGLSESVSTKIIMVEIFILVFGMYLIGFYFNREDPLFINSELNFLYNILPIALITLFYGMFAGLFYFAIFTGFAYILYPSISYTYFLSLFLLLLVFSEFWFYWNGKLKEADIEYNYMNQRLKDLAKEFTLLKLSHEQLEKAYISKPISLRQLISEIRKDVLLNSDIDIALKKVFDLIIVNYDVEEAFLIEKLSGKAYRLIASKGDIQDIDMEDPLIKTAIESQKITYTSDIRDSEISKYLAVIPVSINDELFYIFVVKRMPFMKLNFETLIVINLMLYYVLTESAEEMYKLEDYNKTLKAFDLIFLKEMYKMMELHKKFSLLSHMVIFCLDIYDNVKFNILEDLISESIRGVDLSTTVYIDKEAKAIAVILPFTDDFGTELFIRRIKGLIVKELGQEFVEKELIIKTYRITEKHIKKLKVCHEA